MDAEVRARLIAVADRAVEDYDSGAEPYRSVGEAVIDALRIQRMGSYMGDDLCPSFEHNLPASEDGDVFRLVGLSLPPQKETA